MDLACAVHMMPRPERPADPTSSASLERYRFHVNVYHLLMDVASRPALREYLPQYLREMQAIRDATRELCAAADLLDEHLSTLAHLYQDCQTMPDYFRELLQDFASQVRQ